VVGPTAGEQAPDEASEPVGWRVLDPDGNVVASGPLITLEMVTNMGEEVGNGSD
jgi:hypothetical protein